MTKKYIHFYLILTLLLSACSNLKYLPEGELLYVGGKVDVKGEKISRREKKQLEENLKDLLRPRPNSKILGLRPKLYIYNIAGEPKKEKGFKYWLKNKVGEPPVLFSQVNMEYNEDLLQNFVENKGFFNAKTSSDSTTRNKKVKTEYSISLNNRYFIKEVSFPKDSSQITAAVSSIRENSFLKPGKPYDLDVIKAERVRIDANLKENGYYYFNPDYLLVQVDSTIGNREVSLRLKVKNETPEKAKNIYKINNI